MFLSHSPRSKTILQRTNLPMTWQRGDGESSKQNKPSAFGSAAGPVQKSNCWTDQLTTLKPPIAALDLCAPGAALHWCCGWPGRTKGCVWSSPRGTTLSVDTQTQQGADTCLRQPHFPASGCELLYPVLSLLWGVSAPPVPKITLKNQRQTLHQFTGCPNLT